MKEENGLLTKDKASLKLIIGNKLKEFFQAHDIDKMTQKYSDDLRTLSQLHSKTKQLLQHNQVILEISQHQCRKCQLRMLEELNQNRSKTPTRAFPINSKQEHSHTHSLINLRVPERRGMTPDLHITGSHIGVVPPQKFKGKVNTSRFSPSKKPNPNSFFTPNTSRSKSPSDLTLIKNRKNITKSPTAATPTKGSKGSKIIIQGKGNKGALTPSKTDRNVTHKHTRGVTSLSKEKDKEQYKGKSNDKNDKKHSRFNTSVSGEKNKAITIKKSPVNTETNLKGNKPALSPNIKKNIKTPVIGKNKAKDQTKSPDYSNNSSTNKIDDTKDEYVQQSINEINKTVKGLKESLKIMNDSDDEIVTKGPIRSKNIKTPKEEHHKHKHKDEDDDDNSEDEDSNDEAILMERQLLKREKEKRIMDKLRSEKTKAPNREASPDFNTKNKDVTAIRPNDLQVASSNQSSGIDITIQKKELHRSTNYEISSHQKNEILGISTSQSSNGKKDFKQEKGEEFSYKNKGKEQDVDKGNNSYNHTVIDPIRDSGSHNEKKKQNYQIENASIMNKVIDIKQNKDNTKAKDKAKDKDYDRVNEDEDEDESKIMKEKREKIREKVMEKRKEKEKSKEKIVKDKNIPVYNETNTNIIITSTPHKTTNSDSKRNSPPYQIEQQDKTKGHNHPSYTKDQPTQQPITTLSPLDNKLLKLLVVTLNSGYINISKKISIITSSPQLLPAFQLKHLLVEKIAILMKQSSKVKAFLSKYDQQIFTKPFSLSKIASSSISLITKEDELALCKRPQHREILSIFTVLYIILNESHYEVPTKDLVVNMVQVLLKKYQVDSIKSLLLNIIPKKAAVNEKQMDLLMEIKEASPTILIPSEITKISKTASYICFILQELYDYIFVQYSDGTTLYQVKKAVKEERALEARIAFLQSYL